MARRTTTLGSRSTISKFLTQERMTGSDNDLATTHEINRQSVVKEILVYVFLMGKFKMVGPTMTRTAATTQYYSSKASDKRQAAHCAPAQIKFNGKDIYELLPPDLSRVLEDLFGTTDGLPIAMNESDSVAESNGLCDALMVACNEAARLGQFAKFTYANEFFPTLVSIFQVYKAAALLAFQEGIKAQKNLMNKPTTVNKAYHEQKIQILKTYFLTLSSADDSHDTVGSLDPDAIYREFCRFKKDSAAGQP